MLTSNRCMPWFLGVSSQCFSMVQQPVDVCMQVLSGTQGVLTEMVLDARACAVDEVVASSALLMFCWADATMHTCDLRAHALPASRPAGVSLPCWWQGRRVCGMAGWWWRQLAVDRLPAACATTVQLLLLPLSVRSHAAAELCASAASIGAGQTRLNSGDCFAVHAWQAQSAHQTCRRAGAGDLLTSQAQDATAHFGSAHGGGRSRASLCAQAQSDAATAVAALKVRDCCSRASL